MRAKSSNVKFSRKYESFGEIIRYLSVSELNQLASCKKVSNSVY
jgi:hypothetical protein